jgi:pyruvate/2-oxoglutarate dehydrogenase complex dihydrolipoamide dehydrogenase (E3) component
LKPDLCIVGAGSAGLSVASIAASFGASVVLIEKHRMGGECLNTGCVPSKALIAAAHRAHALRQADRFGIGCRNGEAAIDFAQVQRHIKGAVAAIGPMDSAERYAAMGVQVIRAEAVFRDARTVMAGDRTIKARRFVIATGSRPAIPDIPGLNQVPYLTNETIFDLEEKPGHLVVIGAGAIGVELAQAYRRLDARVTLLEAGEHILGREDPEMAAVVERALRREGIALVCGEAIKGIEPRPDDRFAVMLEKGGIVEGSHLLVAAGRRAAIEGLQLEAAGIKVDASGIFVGRNLKTSNAKVYAIGDCMGGEGGGGRFTHAASHQAGLVIRNALFGLPVRLGRTPVPRVTYTDPELAAVGATEEEARVRHGSIRILRWAFADNDRARAEGENEGHVKALVTEHGTILGCAIAGRQAGELIMPWVLAMSRGLKVSDLAGLVYPYPTLSEATKSAAVEFLKPSAQNPWLRRLMGFVRRIG